MCLHCCRGTKEREKERDRDILARSAFYDGPRDVCVSLPGEMTAVSGPLSSPLYDDAAAAQKLWMILQGNSAQTLLMASSDKYVPRSILLSHGSLSAFAVDVRGTGKKKTMFWRLIYSFFSLPFSFIAAKMTISPPYKIFYFSSPERKFIPGLLKIAILYTGLFHLFPQVIRTLRDETLCLAANFLIETRRRRVHVTVVTGYDVPIIRRGRLLAQYNTLFPEKTTRFALKLNSSAQMLSSRSIFLAC